MRKNRLFPVLFVFFLDNLGFALVIPLLGPLLLNPDYGLLAKDLSLSTKNWLLGLTIAIFPFAQFFGAPLFGEMADNQGRKKAFYFTIVGVLIGYILSGCALLLHHFWLLFFSRLVTGFFSGNLAICLAAISDMSSDVKERAKNFSLIATLAGVSWVVAILIGGDLSNPQLLHLFSPSLPFWIVSLLTVFSLLAIIKFFKETHPPKNVELKFSVLKGFRNIFLPFTLKKLRMLYLVHFLWLLGWVVAIQWFAGYSIEKYQASQVKIATVFVLLGVVWSFGSSVVNRLLIQRFKISSICVAGLLWISICFGIGFKSSNFETFSIFYLLASLVASFVWSNIVNLISVSASDQIQGKIMGIGQSMMSSAQFLGPLCAAYIAIHQLGDLFLYAGLSIFIAFFLLLIRQSLYRS